MEMSKGLTPTKAGTLESEGEASIMDDRVESGSWITDISITGAVDWVLLCRALLQPSCRFQGHRFEEGVLF